MRQPYLSYSGRGLAFFQSQLSRSQIQVPPAEGNGAGRDQDDFLTALAEGGNVGDEALEPGTIEPALVAIHQQGRTDFDDHAPRIGQATSGNFSVSDGHKTSILPFT
jgi:hypothetical protein